MTKQQIELVQSTWAKVIPMSEQAAVLFYEKLFELDPSLESMFPDDIQPQGEKLMKMITVAVNGLSNLEQIVPAVEALGERHVGYGVTDEHYDTVGEALIWTLGTGLGDDFTDEVVAAWADVYNLLASTMKNAAQKAAA